MDILANILSHEAKAVDFTGLDVKFILSGQKTQFRRPVNVPRILRVLGCNLESSSINRDDPLNECIRFHGSNDPRATSARWLAVNYYCPFGRSGDSLWVREPYQETPSGRTIYRADNDGLEENLVTDKWISAGEMPISLSRGTIEITSIRLQRLGLMTEDEAKAEGMQVSFYNPTYLQAFASFWNKVNKQDWYRFENCPLVWVVEFSSDLNPKEQTFELDNEVEEVFV